MSYEAADQGNVSLDCDVSGTKEITWPDMKELELVILLDKLKMHGHHRKAWFCLVRKTTAVFI